jgi:predicted HTH transcriptional regulator
VDPDLWKIDRYADFLEARRELMARKLNEFMASLIAEPQEKHERSLEELIALEESATLEFKSTLQWDVVQNQSNKHLRQSVLKTIGAFLNSEGGTLVIGVDDDKSVLGLDRDLKLLGGSLDRFGQLLSSLVTDHIGPEYARLVKLHTPGVNGKQVCVVDVDKAPEPAFVGSSRGKEFYVRVGNTTRALDPEETMRYIELTWGQS